MSVEEFFTLSEVTIRDQVIEKSHFIGIAVPLTTLEQVEKSMHKIHEDYPSARHYVYAYRLHNGFTR